MTSIDLPATRSHRGGHLVATADRQRSGAGVVSGGLEVGELPGAVEGGSVGSVDAEVDEPADAGQCLDPGAVSRAADGWLGSEVQPGGLAGGCSGEFEQGPDSGLVLIGADLAAGAGVV